MNKKTNEEIVAFMLTIFDERDVEIQVEQNTDTQIDVCVTQMYSYVEYALPDLMKMSAFFGTQKINDSRYSMSGCGTCDYGSSYEVTFHIKD